MQYIQQEGDLQEVYEKAYQQEQEICRLELKVEYWKTRCDTLEKEIERLQGIQIESTCDQCGVNFLQRKKGRVKRFCSKACRQAHYRSNKEYTQLLRRTIAPLL